MSSAPLVSCLMPTRGRREFLPRAIRYFLRQDYANCELVVVDDVEGAVEELVPRHPRIRYARLDRHRSLGEKRNVACELATGPILANWDDDDWYAPWRLSHQVAGLLRSGRDLSGATSHLFYDPRGGQAWEFVHPERRWLAGATLCFTRALWQRYPFPDVEVGEDTIFGTTAGEHGVHRADDRRFCVGILHPGNSAPKNTADPGWQPYSLEGVLDVLGADAAAYTSAPAARANAAPSHMPLVTCVMPTYDRRRFVPRAIEYFLAQDYPRLELIVVDDGSDPVHDLMPDDARVRYVQLDRRRSIGAKRNLACELARGEIVVQWDDDDWYGPGRVAHQVAPIVADEADVTGMDGSLMLDLASTQFWRCRDDLSERMFFRGLNCGTLAFRRDLWFRSGGYPDDSLAEDMTLLQQALLRGARLARLERRETYVYVRHGGNSWQFECGEHDDPAGWERVQAPPFFPADAARFYAGFATAG